MGFLKGMIREGISKGVGDAIGKAVQQAVEPAATRYANRTAEHLDNAAQNTARESRQAMSGLEGAFANLERAAQGYATEMSRNVKVCPGCGQPTGADKKFCPSCGVKLPEETLAQGALCPSCGRQNSVGTRFCQDCGSKLPAAVQEEYMAQQKDAAVMAQWDELLYIYPKWNCGGSDFYIERYEADQFMFAASFAGDSHQAQNAVKAYRMLLQENGFRPAGQYPSVQHLYRMVNGFCYHVDTEHCFDGDPDCPCIYFSIGEPHGGFSYVKPEPKKQVGLKDLFKF